MPKDKRNKVPRLPKEIQSKFPEAIVDHIHRFLYKRKPPLTVQIIENIKETQRMLDDLRKETKELQIQLAILAENAGFYRYRDYQEV